SNWANNSLTLQRRNKFFCALVQVLRQIPICGPGGGGFPGSEGKPMYTVRITDEKAQENMAADKEKKLSKRWDYAPPAPPVPASESEISPAPNPSSGNAPGVQHNFPGSHNLSPFADPSGRRKSNASSTRSRSIDNSSGFLHREPTRGRRRPVKDLNPTPKAPKE
ncbi:hypothetical protein RUND412_011396, partial [Rhizina undulata]